MLENGIACDSGECFLRCLDLSGRDCGLLVVGGKLRGLGSDALENIYTRHVRSHEKIARIDRILHTIDERVEDRHGAVGDTGVGVDLLQDCVGLANIIREKNANTKDGCKDVNSPL